MAAATLLCVPEAPAHAGPPAARGKQAAVTAAKRPAESPRRGAKGEANKATPSSACEAVLALGETDAAPPELLRRAHAEGLMKSDHECLSMTGLRFMNQGNCETASLAAKRARELAPSDPLAVLSGAMASACELGKRAAEQGGGVPIECDAATIQEITYGVGRAAILASSTNGVVPLVVRSLEADVVPRCRDDGQMKALFAALEMFAPEVRSPALRVLEKEPNVPWNLTGAIQLLRLDRQLSTGDPGPGGHEASRAIARQLLAAWPALGADGVTPRAHSLYAQAVARTQLKSGAALATKSEGFGAFIDDLDDLERQGMLDSLPVLEAAADMPFWAVDAALGTRNEERLRSLAERLTPLEVRPEGALLLFKLRSVTALRADAAPCDVSRSLGGALASFANHGAARMPLRAYSEVVRHVATRARNAARRCENGMPQIAELSRILVALQAETPPWSPITHVEGGGR